MTTATAPSTRFATSADGTRIAYDTTGAGPALVLVDGALCQRSMGPSRGLAEALAGSFTVHAYDRRGRGESGAGESAYEPAREVEDLLAVLEAAGGHAHVLGTSSGGTLALEAARAGAPVDRLVVYEAPVIVDDSHAPNDPRLPERLQEQVDAGRRGDAVRLFLRTVGAPAPIIALMRFMPPWKKMTAVAHTLPYDLRLVIDQQQGRPIPDGYYAGVGCPTLVVVGGKSPTYMQTGQAAIAAALPDARLETLAGQTHMVKPRPLAPLVTAFLEE
jgi:pimeloyl-ACP methyl ester carboxylesterase